MPGSEGSRLAAFLLRDLLSPAATLCHVALAALFSVFGSKSLATFLITYTEEGS